MATKKRKGKKTNEAAIATMPSSYDDSKYRAQDDLRTIERAQEVVGDSRRLSAAKAEAKRQKESLDRIARLQDKKL